MSITMLGPVALAGTLAIATTGGAYAIRQATLSPQERLQDEKDRQAVINKAGDIFNQAKSSLSELPQFMANWRDPTERDLGPQEVNRRSDNRAGWGGENNRNNGGGNNGGGGNGSNIACGVLLANNVVHGYLWGSSDSKIVTTTTALGTGVTGAALKLCPNPITSAIGVGGTALGTGIVTDQTRQKTEKTPAK